MSEIVETHAEAAALPLAPLLVRAPLAAFLDARGIGSGPLSARRIGDGQSNVTYLLERAGARVVLRRPPRPPLPPSAHDMLREARLIAGLARAGARVPEILAVCDDEAVLGVPFYVMAEIDGFVVADAVPPALDPPAQRRALGEELVDALAEVHAADWRAAGLEGIGRPDGYLERQVRRFAGLWEVNATRALPVVEELAGWLEANRPASPPAAVVHGDYRLGNVMVAREAPARVLAVLDWELATIGDPLADLGYLVATWSEPGAPATPLHLSPVTALPGFPRGDELVGRYVERTGADVRALPWYRVLALFKAAVFCEAIYGRYLRGERADAWAASLEDGIPALLSAAAASR